MSNIAAWQRIFIRPEIFVYIAPFFFLALFFVLNPYVDRGDHGVIEHYVDLNWMGFLWTGGLLGGAIAARGIVFWVMAFVNDINPARVFNIRYVKYRISKIPGILKNFAVIGLPFAFAFYTLSLALGPLNVFNATRLQDELLFSWDLFITGTFPALSLASFQYPSWFVHTVEFSFFYIVSILTIFGAYLFLFHYKLFREAGGAFFLSLFIMFVGWLAFPVLSPHERFVTDEYNLSIPAEVQPFVDSYQPQEEISVLWDKINESREHLTVLPTTAIPSAHVVWAVFIVYYSYRISKWLVIASFPLAVLSTLGTNLFAAHYFVDIPAGIVTGVVSIICVSWLRKKQLEYNVKSIIMSKEYG